MRSLSGVVFLEESLDKSLSYETLKEILRDKESFHIYINSRLSKFEQRRLDCSAIQNDLDSVFNTMLHYGLLSRLPQYHVREESGNVSVFFDGFSLPHLPPRRPNSLEYFNV